MIKNINKVLGLITLLICGVWTAQAQSVSISPNGSSVSSSFYCMDVDDMGTQFQANGINLSNSSTTGTIVQYTWTAIGGIYIKTGQGTSAVTVAPLTGTDYANGYSQYAKGKLRVTCKVEHSYDYPYTIIHDPCSVPPDIETGTRTYTYHIDYTDEIEIRKEFSDLTGNEIAGPKCVREDQRVTYSVAPWVSLHELNTVGFDKYYWDIPPGVAKNGVLYYSADGSSVTFEVGSAFDGKTITVRMGACNSSQTEIEKTLGVNAKVPAINSASPVCVTAGTPQTFRIRQIDPNVTYEWDYPPSWEEDDLGQGYITLIPDNTGGEVKVKAIGCEETDWSDAIEVSSAGLKLKKLTNCVDAGLPGHIEIQIENYDTVNVQYGTPVIDDPTFGAIDPSGIDANGIFIVYTTGKVGNFAVSLSATLLASHSCGGGTTSDTLQYTVQKKQFAVTENTMMSFPFLIKSFAVYVNDVNFYNEHTFEWTVNGQTPYPTYLGLPYLTDGVNMTFLPQQDSIIYVTVTDTSGCKTRMYREISSGQEVFRSATVNEFMSDIFDEQNAEGQLTLYPNPASTELTINMSSQENINFCIVSMSGSIVKENINQQPTTTIDVSNWAAGTYIVAVQQGKNRYTKQFIKK